MLELKYFPNEFSLSDDKHRHCYEGDMKIIPLKQAILQAFENSDNTLPFKSKNRYVGRCRPLTEHLHCMMNLNAHDFDEEVSKRAEFLRNSLTELKKCSLSCREKCQSEDEIFEKRFSWIPIVYQEVFENASYVMHESIDLDCYTFKPIFHSKELIVDCKFNLLECTDYLKRITIGLLYTPHNNLQAALLCNGPDVYFMEAEQYKWNITHQYNINTVEGLCKCYALIFELFFDMNPRTNPQLKSFLNGITRDYNPNREWIYKGIHQTVQYYPNSFVDPNKQCQTLQDEILESVKNSDNTLPFKYPNHVTYYGNNEKFNWYLTCLMSMKEKKFEKEIENFGGLSNSLRELRKCCSNIGKRPPFESDIFKYRLSWIKTLYEDMIGNSYQMNEYIKQALGDEYDYKPVFYSKTLIVDCKYVLNRDVLKKMSMALVYCTKSETRQSVLCTENQIYFIEALSWSYLTVHSKIDGTSIEGLCKAFAITFDNFDSVIRRNLFYNIMPYATKEEKENVYSFRAMKETMINCANNVKKRVLKKFDSQQKLEDKKKMCLEDVKKRSEHILRNATIWEHPNTESKKRKTQPNQEDQDNKGSQQ